MQSKSHTDTARSFRRGSRHGRGDCIRAHCSPPEPGAAEQILKFCMRPFCPEHLGVQGPRHVSICGCRCDAPGPRQDASRRLFSGACLLEWSWASRGRGSGAATGCELVTAKRPLFAEVAPAHPPRAQRTLANGTGAAKTPCRRPRPSTPLATGLSPGPPSRSRCAPCPHPRAAAKASFAARSVRPRVDTQARRRPLCNRCKGGNTRL